MAMIMLFPAPWGWPHPLFLYPNPVGLDEGRDVGFWSVPASMPYGPLSEPAPSLHAPFLLFAKWARHPVDEKLADGGRLGVRGLAHT